VGTVNIGSRAPMCPLLLLRYVREGPLSYKTNAQARIELISNPNTSVLTYHDTNEIYQSDACAALCADNGNRGRVGAEANLELWLTGLPSLTTGESKFGVTFDWEVAKLGVPGAIIVKNHHSSEFFLKTITLDDVPGRGTLTFVANSWVYPQSKYRYNRVFFTNDVSLSLSLCPSSLFFR
jgi:hypothetical protein